MEQNGITAETWIAGQYGGENNPIELIWEEINDHIRYIFMYFYKFDGFIIK